MFRSVSRVLQQQMLTKNYQVQLFLSKIKKTTSSNV
jgi:hypothetical protein